MKYPLFKLEEFWKKYEFTTPYLLCPSDAETLSMKELLALADSETLKLWEDLTLGYTESPGHPFLRQELAKLYSLNSENILTTAGAEEGIYCTMQTLVDEGDHVIVVTPCYQSLKSIPQSLGANITEIELDSENNWKMDIEKFKTTFHSKTKLIVLNVPHNPTGSILDLKTYNSIIELARTNGAYIFSDEVYQGLELDESKRLPAIAEAYEKGISLNVMSKSYGLAGLRIGWLVSQDIEFLKQAGSIKLYTSICNSAPSEILALIAVRAKDTVLKRNRKIMSDNLAVLDPFFKKHSHLFKWKRPDSGPIAFTELLEHAVDPFIERLAQEAGILLMPGSVYDYKGNFLRFGFGRKNLPEIIDRLDKYLSSRF